VAGARRLADEVRVGLGDTVSLTLAVNSDARRKDPLEENWFGKPVRHHVREFGLLFAAIGFAIVAVKLYRGADMSGLLSWIGAATVCAVLGLFAPRALLPLWRGWMKLAHYLSIVMTSVILSLAWCIGFLPMAGILKVLGIKRMDLSYKNGAASYWESRDSKYDDFKRLELQF
jgi:hypothetical protein